MEVLWFILSVVIGVVILTLLVVVHELGHALVARKNGVVVKEFGIGFPPRAKAWLKKKSFLGNDVEYSLNWLPIGGFVQLKGEYDSSKEKGGYGAATLWQKTKILLAGVAMNWLVAIVLFTALALIGMPKLIANQFTLAGDTHTVHYPLVIGKVVSGSPAEKAGLKVNDTITAVNGSTAAADVQEAHDLTKANAGKDITVTFERQGSPAQTVTAHLNPVGGVAEKQGYLGVQFSQKTTTYRSTWSAPVVGVVLTGQLTLETFRGLGDSLAKTATGWYGKITGNAAEQKIADSKLADASNAVSGPLAIFGMFFPEAVKSGFASVLLISALISLSLAVMNVLPIPGLDGGRWYTTLIFHALKKPLTKEREEKIQAVGMYIIFGLVVLVTVLDVFKFMK